MATDLRIERICGDLSGLVPGWWALWLADPFATPFQSPAWLIPWAETFQPDATTVWTARDGAGGLRALLPMFRHGGRMLVLGAGNSDWLGALCVPGPDGAGALPALLSRAGECGPLELGQLDPESPLAKAPAPAGWAEERGWGEPCPALPLPARLSRGLRQSLRTARNRLDRIGSVAVDHYQPGMMPGALDTLFDLHARRWQGRGEAGVLADPAIRRFHRAAMPRLAAAGLARKVVLRLDGRAVGCLYGLQAKRVFHHYLAGFDPDLAIASPGALCIQAAMDAATAEGCRLFDFLRGREPYKYRWGAVDRPTLNRVLVPPAP